ncbi:MAG: MarR family winged helix-turn-helix transcriptional regulator [Sphingomonadaceae bacterium]
MANGAKPEPGSDEAEVRLGLLIRLLKLGSFINTPMKEGVSDPAGVGTTELRVVMALAGEGALAGHDLVGIMGMPPMNVSRALASLRERGWIEYAPDPENRRRRPMVLTEAGHEAYTKMQGNLSAVADALVGGLGPRRQQQFAAIADELIDAMADWISSRHEDMKIKR